MLPAHSLPHKDSAHAQRRFVVAARPRRALHPAGGATVADDRFLHRQRRPRRPRPFPRRQRNRTGTDRRRLRRGLRRVPGDGRPAWRQLRPSPPVRSRRRPVRRRLVALRAGRFGLAAAGGARPAGRRRGADRAADSRHPACQPQRPRAFPRAGRLRRHRRPGLRRRPGARRLPGLRRHRRPRLAQRVPDQPADLPRHSPLQPPLGTGDPRRACRPRRRAGHPAARRADPLPAAAAGSRPIAALVLALRPAAGGGGAAAGLAVAHRAAPGTPPGLAVAAAVAAAPAEHPLRPVTGDPVLRLLERLHVRPRPGPAGRRRSRRYRPAMPSSPSAPPTSSRRCSPPGWRRGSARYACCCSAASSRCAACSA